MSTHSAAGKARVHVVDEPPWFGRSSYYSPAAAAGPSINVNSLQDALSATDKNQQQQQRAAVLGRDIWTDVQ